MLSLAFFFEKSENTLLSLTFVFVEKSEKIDIAVAKNLKFEIFLELVWKWKINCCDALIKKNKKMTAVWKKSTNNGQEELPLLSCVFVKKKKGTSQQCKKVVKIKVNGYQQPTRSADEP